MDRNPTAARDVEFICNNISLAGYFCSFNVAWVHRKIFIHDGWCELDLLAALNLSQLSKVQQAVRAVQKIEDRKLDTEEKKDLLRRIEYTTQQQTEVILSQALSLPILIDDKEKYHRDESVTLSITLSKEQMALLKQAQDLISHVVPEKKWAEVITYLAQKEVQHRTKLKSTKITTAAGVKTNDLENSNVSKAEPARKSLRNSIKKIVLNQDRCCQYKDRMTGKICGSTRFLQIDHRHSVWAGGSNELKNLQILCAQHNQNKYRMEKFLR